MAKNSKKDFKKVNDQRKITKLTKEDRLASALKKNIRLRKEKQSKS